MLNVKCIVFKRSFFSLINHPKCSIVNVTFTHGQSYSAFIHSAITHHSYSETAIRMKCLAQGHFGPADWRSLGSNGERTIDPNVIGRPSLFPEPRPPRCQQEEVRIQRSVTTHYRSTVHHLARGDRNRNS